MRSEGNGKAERAVVDNTRGAGTRDSHERTFASAFPPDPRPVDRDGQPATLGRARRQGELEQAGSESRVGLFTSSLVDIGRRVRMTGNVGRGCRPPAAFSLAPPSESASSGPFGTQVVYGKSSPSARAARPIGRGPGTPRIGQSAAQPPSGRTQRNFFWGEPSPSGGGASRTAQASRFTAPPDADPMRGISSNHSSPAEARCREVPRGGRGGAGRRRAGEQCCTRREGDLPSCARYTITACRTESRGKSMWCSRRREST